MKPHSTSFFVRSLHTWMIPLGPDTQSGWSHELRDPKQGSDEPWSKLLVRGLYRGSMACSLQSLGFFAASLDHG